MTQGFYLETIHARPHDPLVCTAIRLPRGLTMEFANNRTNAVASIDAGLRAHMMSVYNVMAGGLALSAVVAGTLAWTSAGHLFFIHSGRTHFSPTGLGLAAMFVPLVMLLIAAFSNASLWSVSRLKLFYWVFTAFEGVGLSTALMTHGGVDVTRALLATAAAFAGMGIWGYTTGKSLSGLASFCLMGLFGMIAVSILTMIFGFTIPSFLFGAVGVVVFSGLTAYDTQQIKDNYLTHGDDSGRAVIWSALSLYLDAVNLFRSLLNLMSRD